jgi:hypothetical protein
MAELPDARELVEQAASDGDGHPWARACLTRIAGRLHADTAALAESARQWERLGARVEHAATLLLLPEPLKRVLRGGQ